MEKGLETELALGYLKRSEASKVPFTKSLTHAGASALPVL